MPGELQIRKKAKITNEKRHICDMLFGHPFYRSGAEKLTDEQLIADAMADYPSAKYITKLKTNQTYIGVFNSIQEIMLHIEQQKPYDFSMRLVRSIQHKGGRPLIAYIVDDKRDINANEYENYFVPTLKAACEMLKIPFNRSDVHALFAEGEGFQITYDGVMFETDTEINEFHSMLAYCRTELFPQWQTAIEVKGKIEFRECFVFNPIDGSPALLPYSSRSGNKLFPVEREDLRNFVVFNREYSVPNFTYYSNRGRNEVQTALAYEKMSPTVQWITCVIQQKAPGLELSDTLVGDRVYLKNVNNHRCLITPDEFHEDTEMWQYLTICPRGRVFYRCEHKACIGKNKFVLLADMNNLGSNTFDRDDPYIWGNFYEDVQSRVFPSLIDAVEFMKPRVRKVLVKINRGEGFFIQKADCNKELFLHLPSRTQFRGFNVTFKTEKVDKRKKDAEPQEIQVKQPFSKIMDDFSGELFDSYVKADIYPNNHECPKNVFNTWLPMRAREVDGDVDMSVVTPWLDVMKLSCGNDEKKMLYQLAWWRIAFCEPHLRPATSLVYQGVPGSGKSFLIEFFQEFIFGEENSRTFNGIDQVLDKFSGLKACKRLWYITELKEVANKDQFTALKHMITGKYIPERPMNVAQYEARNCAVQVFDSNYFTAVFIEEGDRRYVIFIMSNERRGDIAYWKTMHDKYCNQYAANHLYTWFKRLDTTKLPNVLELPESGMKELITEMSETPVSAWIKEFVAKNTESKTFTHAELMSQFKEFLDNPDNQFSIRAIHDIRKHFITGIIQSGYFKATRIDTDGKKKRQIIYTSPSAQQKEKRAQSLTINSLNI